MAMDVFRNFSYGTIVVPPTPPNLGTSLTVGNGHSARFPAPPFSASVWPIGVPADPTNAEIIRVTAIGGDVWTIVRAQEGTAARAILNTDQVAQALTAQSIADLKADALAAAQAWVNSQGFAAKTYVDAQDTAVENWVNANFATINWVNQNFPTTNWINSQNYATQPWVNAQGFALKSYVDSQDTNVQNWVNANFATINWINSQNYATQAWVNGQAFATQAWVNGQAFATQQWVSSNFVLISDIRSHVLPLISIVHVVAGSPTLTPNCAVDITAVDDLSVNLTIANPIGTPVDGQALIIRLRDTGTTQTLAWGNRYWNMNAQQVLPAVTGGAQRSVHILLRYNSAYGMWGCLAVAKE
jgi:hypothetical protein